MWSYLTGLSKLASVWFKPLSLHFWTIQCSWILCQFFFISRSLSYLFYSLSLSLTHTHTRTQTCSIFLFCFTQKHTFNIHILFLFTAHFGWLLFKNAFRKILQFGSKISIKNTFFSMLAGSCYPWEVVNFTKKKTHAPILY